MTYPFIEANNHILNLDPTHVERLRKKHESCAYADYLNKYLRFPPPSHQPPLPAVPKQGCDTFNMYNEVYQFASIDLADDTDDLLVRQSQRSILVSSTQKAMLIQVKGYLHLQCLSYNRQLPSTW